MEKFDNLIGAVINKTAIRMRLELGKLLQANQIDITNDQYVVLNRLWEKEGMTQIELAQMTYKDKSSITRIIDLLEQKGYVERRTIVGDRRAYQIYVTSKAMEIREKTRRLALENIARGTRDIAREDLDKMIEVLNKIHANYNL